MLHNAQALLASGLRDFSLTEYEAKIYIVLSRDFFTSGATALELCKVSGIAYTKVYSVLSSLNKKGLIEIKRGKPAQFKLTDPETSFGNLKGERIARVSKAHERVLSSLRTISMNATRMKIEQQREHGASWNIQGKKNVINKLSEQIAQSHQNLKIVFPNLNFLGDRILEQIRARSVELDTSLIVSRVDKRSVTEFSNSNIRYNESIKSRYALFDDRYSLMIAVESPDYWTGVFETCGNCTRQAFEHFDLAWKASKPL